MKKFNFRKFLKNNRSFFVFVLVYAVFRSAYGVRISLIYFKVKDIFQWIKTTPM